jgi:hypothetical protein
VCFSIYLCFFISFIVVMLLSRIVILVIEQLHFVFAFELHLDLIHKKQVMIVYHKLEGSGSLSFYSERYV